MTDQWMSIVEYARTYSISDMTVRRRIKTGRLHAELRDGKYFIPVKDGSAGRSNSSASPSHPVMPRAHSSTVLSEPTLPEQSSELFHVRGRPAESVIPRQVFTPSSKGSDSYAQDSGKESSRSTDELRLIAALEQSIRCLREAEQRMEVAYSRQIEHLQSEITVRDLKINQLGQRVDDLETLVKMLEKSS